MRIGNCVRKKMCTNDIIEREYLKGVVYYAKKNQFKTNQQELADKKLKPGIYPRHKKQKGLYCK